MSKDAWKRFSDKGYKHYDIMDAGFKYNMTDIQAAIGLEQLKKIKKHLIIRNNIWKIYQDFLKIMKFKPHQLLKKIQFTQNIYIQF